MAGDQVPVLGGDEVGLDVVGAHLDRQRVALERVVGQVAGRAAVADDEREIGLAVVAVMAAVVAAAVARCGGRDEDERARGGSQRERGRGTLMKRPFPERVRIGRP